MSVPDHDKHPNQDEYFYYDEYIDLKGYLDNDDQLANFWINNNSPLFLRIFILSGTAVRPSQMSDQLCVRYPNDSRGFTL